MASWKKYLKTIYNDAAHPGGFAGPQKLYKVVKSEGKYQIGMHKIRQFLHDQESYSLHKPVRRRFQRNHVISAGKDDLWMADLIDMVKYADWNQGYKYILLVIDTFSKYVWLQPLKYKTGGEVANAFKTIFDSSKRSPTKLITDKGAKRASEKLVQERAKLARSIQARDNDKRKAEHKRSTRSKMAERRGVKHAGQAAQQHERKGTLANQHGRRNMHANKRENHGGQNKMAARAQHRARNMATNKRRLHARNENAGKENVNEKKMAARRRIAAERKKMHARRNMAEHGKLENTKKMNEKANKKMVEKGHEIPARNQQDKSSLLQRLKAVMHKKTYEETNEAEKKAEEEEH